MPNSQPSIRTFNELDIWGGEDTEDLLDEPPAQLQDDKTRDSLVQSYQSFLGNDNDSSFDDDNMPQKTTYTTEDCMTQIAKINGQLAQISLAKFSHSMNPNINQIIENCDDEDKKNDIFVFIQTSLVNLSTIIEAVRSTKNTQLSHGEQKPHPHPKDINDINNNLLQLHAELQNLSSFQLRHLATYHSEIIIKNHQAHDRQRVFHRLGIVLAGVVAGLAALSFGVGLVALVPAILLAASLIPLVAAVGCLVAGAVVLGGFYLGALVTNTADLSLEEREKFEKFLIKDGKRVLTATEVSALLKYYRTPSTDELLGERDINEQALPEYQELRSTQGLRVTSFPNSMFYQHEVYGEMRGKYDALLDYANSPPSSY